MSSEAVWKAVQQGNHWFGPSRRQPLADGGAICLIAGVGLALTGASVAQECGADLGPAFAVAG
jgi:hypothetical protein